MPCKGRTAVLKMTDQKNSTGLPGLPALLRTSSLRKKCGREKRIRTDGCFDDLFDDLFEKLPDDPGHQGVGLAGAGQAGGFEAGDHSPLATEDSGDARVRGGVESHVQGTEAP